MAAFDARWMERWQALVNQDSVTKVIGRHLSAECGEAGCAKRTSSHPRCLHGGWERFRQNSHDLCPGHRPSGAIALVLLLQGVPRHSLSAVSPPS